MTTLFIGSAALLARLAGSLSGETVLPWFHTGAAELNRF